MIGDTQHSLICSVRGFAGHLEERWKPWIAPWAL
jgi:hypothetical protein